MKLAIMQPYFFPYLGYFQLISAVDTFVIYDDVNFIKKGYIHRNSVLINGKENRITLELMGVSQNKLINQIELGNNAVKLLKSIEMAYKKSPLFDLAFPILESCFLYKEKNLAKFLGNSLITLSKYLGLSTKFLISSELVKKNELKGQKKILDIASNLGAMTYINAIGGQELYSKSMFESQKMALKFLKPRLSEYSQFHQPFTPSLSIIDVMMFNDKNIISRMLQQYELI